jgi:hypothetical protein
MNDFWPRIVGLVAILGPMMLALGVFGWDAKRSRTKPPH